MRTPYTTISDVENYLLTDIQGDFEPQVESWIRGVSDMMDKIANRKLVADTIEGEDDPFEDRYFDGNQRLQLLIDDAVEIHAVEVNKAAISFDPYPKIAPHIKIISNSGFPRGMQNIKVAAKWGLFETVPDDIKLACTIIVAGVINATLKKIGKTSEKIGNFQVSYATDQGITDFQNALSIIKSYRKIEI